MKNIRHHALIALFLVLACVLTVALAACNGTGDPTATTGTTATTGGAPAQSTSTTAQGGSNAPTRITYTVTVVDSEGNPIVGVDVQLCDKETGICRMPETTDENGQVSFRVVAANYEAAFPEAPAGYACEEKYAFPEGETSLTITLTPAA